MRAGFSQVVRPWMAHVVGLLVSGGFLLLLIPSLMMELDGEHASLPGYFVLAGLGLVIMGNLLALRWERAGGMAVVVSALLLGQAMTISILTTSSDPRNMGVAEWPVSLALGFVTIVGPALAAGIAHLLAARQSTVSPAVQAASAH